MPDKYYYLAIDIGVVAIPFLFAFHPRLRFDRDFKPFAIACLLTMIPFIAWDIAFTQVGVWGFNERYLTGISLLKLPIEEWLFFVCIPFACVFVYHSMGLVKNSIKVPSRFFLLVGIISVGFIMSAMIWRSQAYTALTFLLTGIVLGWVAWVGRPSWFVRAVLAYIAVTPFFFISNGLLTGSWIPEQIVWYNDAESFGIRLGTIPIEDLVYGFLLVSLTIILYERYRVNVKSD